MIDRTGGSGSSAGITNYQNIYFRQKTDPLFSLLSLPLKKDYRMEIPSMEITSKYLVAVRSSVFKKSPERRQQ
jgi:hypothetical protein